MTRTTHPLADRSPRRALATLLRRPRRVAALAVGVVALLGFGLASAASLGVVSPSLAAGANGVGSCQQGAPVSAALVSVWNGTEFRSSKVTLSGVDGDCAGQKYRLTVVRSSGAPVEVTGQVPAGGTFTTSAFTGIPTSTIQRVEAVIHS